MFGRKSSKKKYIKASTTSLNRMPARSCPSICLRGKPCTLPMILMLLGYCTQGLFADCPVVCECKWKGGKEAVSCVNANFTAIPVTLDPGTQTLDISSNNIGRLRMDEFKKAGLLNLQKIQLSTCRIKIIEKFAFRDLRNVVEVDLSLNLIDVIPTHILSTLPELRDLKLAGNAIHHIGIEAFKNAVHLKKLDISDNKITSINVHAFVGIETSLQVLLLTRNKLTEVESKSFSIIKTLNSLEISSNPWNCSCQIRDFREWISVQNVPISVQPSCKYPLRLRGKPWDALDLDEFACVPKIQSASPKVLGVEGQSITLSCRIDSIPTPHVKWLLKHKIIANNTAISFISGKKNYLLNSENNLSSLTIPAADLQDTGTYVCVAENKAGHTDANITLIVGKKPIDDIEENKAIIAGIVVSIVLIVALCTLSVFCLSVRKRRQSNRWRGGRRTPNGGRCVDDTYEKIEMNKVQAANDKPSIAVGAVASEVSSVMGPGGRRNGDYRVVPNMDTDQENEADEDEDTTYADNIETPTPTNVQTKSETKLWTAAATGRSISSPNSGHWNSNLLDSHLGDSSLDPDDLHIPRRTKEETRDDCMKKPNSIYGIYNESHYSQQPQSIPRIHKTTLQPHILRKQILQEGGSLYSSIPVSSTDLGVGDDNRRYSSRLDNYQPEENNMMYCTLPRKRSYSRRSSYCGSESPLLPGSRCGSSGGESNVEIRSSMRRLSEDCCSYDYNSRTSIYPNLNRRTGSYLNLMSSKQNLYLSSSSPPGALGAPGAPGDSSTQLLNVGALEKRYNNNNTVKTPPSVKFTSIKSLETAKMYDYHSAQLEKLVVGRYHQMEDEIKQLKEACDNLKKLEVYKKQLRNRMYLDSMLMNKSSYSDCEESSSSYATPRSILKKSSQTQAPLLLTTASSSSSTNLLSSSQSREDFITENLLAFSAHTH